MGKPCAARERRALFSGYEGSREAEPKSSKSYFAKTLPGRRPEEACVLSPQSRQRIGMRKISNLGTSKASRDQGAKKARRSPRRAAFF